MKRREFVQGTLVGLAGLALPQTAFAALPKMKLGLVTYQWGKDWDLPTVIKNCELTGFAGVELRSTHKHGVEISLNAEQRAEVRKRFADSPVELVGLGSACEYHSADPAVLKKNIEETKEFIKLCRDTGGSGVKVRPNGFVKDVPHQQTLEQIGKSLREVGVFGAEHGVQIRLEVHGRETCLLPNIREMLDVADHPNVVLCWNCNPTDMEGEGLEANYRLVEKEIGTIHIHDLRNQQYPWGQLFQLLRGSGFDGWTLMEEGKIPDDLIQSMRENRVIWQKLASV
ncbi:MAG: sugar phosphate isomerase/epimerase [Planctomycetaceae bacterium]|nr:sugar phosphate isomerase/epimerase [Planctomycetaceae bacterium]